MKRLPLLSITVLSGIFLSLAISCKKNSSDSSFFKIQLNAESYRLDSFFAFIDSAGPDFYSVSIEGLDTKTNNSVDLFSAQKRDGQRRTNFFALDSRAAVWEPRFGDGQRIANVYDLAADDGAAAQ